MTDDKTQLAMELRNLNAAYCDAVAQRDPGAWGALWSRAGKWILFGETVSGRDAVTARWSAAMAGFAVVHQSIDSEHLLLDGPQPRARVYFTEHLVTTAGDAQRFIGLYHDIYTCEDGHWLYASRELIVLYHGPGVLQREHWQGNTDLSADQTEESQGSQ